jgi:hypothetical protein
LSDYCKFSEGLDSFIASSQAEVCSLRIFLVSCEAALVSLPWFFHWDSLLQLDWRSPRCGAGAGNTRCITRTGNANANRSLAYAIIAIDVGDVIGPGIFIDARIIEYRRAINALSIHGGCENADVR